MAVLPWAMAAAAQDYAPTTTWPYLYKDFTDGTLQTVSGSAREGKYNIHILHGTLHFIDGEYIREASPQEVFSVRIGGEVYTNAKGRMMKVLAKSDKSLVGLETIVDIARLNSTGGAYGSSSNSLSTQALASLESASGLTAANHMMLKNSRNEGKILPLTEKMYLIFGGKVVFAGKKDVMNIEGIDRNSLNAFMKEHKIKWRDPASLLLLADFIAAQDL